MAGSLPQIAHFDFRSLFGASDRLSTRGAEKPICRDPRFDVGARNSVHTGRLSSPPDRLSGCSGRNSATLIPRDPVLRTNPPVPDRVPDFQAAELRLRTAIPDSRSQLTTSGLDIRSLRPEMRQPRRLSSTSEFDARNRPPRSEILSGRLPDPSGQFQPRRPPCFESGPDYSAVVDHSTFAPLRSLLFNRKGT